MNYYYDPETKEIFTDSEIIKKHSNTSFPQRPWNEGVLHYKIAPLVIEEGDAPLGYADKTLVDNGTDSPYVYKAIAGSKTKRDAKTVENMKKSLNQSRKNTRMIDENSGFDFNGHPIQSDKESVQRITNTALSAMIADKQGTKWNIEWTCADNTVLYLDVEGMLSLQATLNQHQQNCHNKSQEMKSSIDSATTIAKLKAIKV